MRKDITNVVFDFGGVVAPADLSIVINKFKALGLEDIEKYLNMVRQQGFFGDFETGLIDKEGVPDPCRQGGRKGSEHG